MNIERVYIALSFLIAFLSALLLPALFPKLRLAFFSPFLALVLERKSLIHCLWLALLSGVCLDLLSAEKHFGLHALSLTVSTFVLYRFRDTLFIDHLLTLPLMTYLFSCLTTLFLIILIPLFERPLALSFSWAMTDFIVLPFADSLYALLFFSGLAQRLRKCPRRTRLIT